MNSFLWCLLLLATAHVCQPASVTVTTPAEENDGGITEEELAAIVESDDNSLIKKSFTEVTEDGEEVNETSVVDEGCNVHISITATNTSNSTVVDDLDDDTELVLMSSSPDVCYVKRVPDAKQTCQNGRTAVDETMVGTETNVTDYEEGKNLTISDLPPLLRKLCVNRTITELVEANTRNATEDDTSAEEDDSADARKKRSLCCRWRMCFRRYRTVVIYRRYCQFLFFRWPCGYYYGWHVRWWWGPCYVCRRWYCFWWW
ncbi:uncharacterized protein LOC143276373 [Babylonia areolata]|uniref:uncharacterized protein LOC143276373 n=1 Tax=Babylonia areolata TaxID=304850 RepID=UPI003FD1DB20